MTTISVIIKAFNEEENIAKAIETSLEAVAEYGGEVIVADSGSTDRTVEIATQYPVIVAQLARPDERCCGIAPQLGYQHCSGEYIYILDGDMTLSASFIKNAIDTLIAEPKVAGVGGLIREMRIANIEFQSRAKRQARRQSKEGSYVDCLNGGGLYRRSAINDVAYISDRNLHSYEEFDLGMRLRTKGWRLLRLKEPAADHFGYTLSTYRLLWHRARSGYILGTGELVRAALTHNYVATALTRLPGLRPAFFVWAYWLAAAIAAQALPTTAQKIALLACAPLTLILIMAARNHFSLKVGLHSVALWHLNAIGLIVGLIRPRRSPIKKIESHLLNSDQRPSTGSLAQAN